MCRTGRSHGLGDRSVDLCSLLGQLGDLSKRLGLRGNQGIGVDLVSPPLQRSSSFGSGRVCSVHPLSLSTTTQNVNIC
jgi:hypothetical protein